MDDLDKYVEERMKQKEAEEKAKAEEKSNTLPVVTEEKSLSDVNLSDIKFSLDKSKSFEEQAEDVVNAIAIAKAVEDENVAKQLTDKKAEELKNKADTKAKKAEQENIQAETNLQKAKRDLYESVLQSFGIYKHLPTWLMVILVFILSPLYAALTFIIGTPCAVVKILIDNLDGIVCRYEESDKQSKPKLKVIFWIILGLVALGAICLTILKCLNKI